MEMENPVAVRTLFVGKRPELDSRSAATRENLNQLLQKDAVRDVRVVRRYVVENVDDGVWERALQGILVDPAGEEVMDAAVIEAAVMDAAVIDGAAAEGAFWVAWIEEVPPVETEVVTAHIANEPGVEIATRRRLEPEKSGPVIEQGRPAARAAKAQIVDIQVPVDAIGRTPPAKHLKQVPAREHLGAEDLVILDLQIIDVEGRLLCVRGKHWPPENREPGDRCRTPKKINDIIGKTIIYLPINSIF